jgi:replicative DNA helicase
MTMYSTSVSNPVGISRHKHQKGEAMTIQQREQLREVLIDYLQLLTQQTDRRLDSKIAQVRLLLREVA